MKEQPYNDVGFMHRKKLFTSKNMNSETSLKEGKGALLVLSSNYNLQLCWKGVPCS